LETNPEARIVTQTAQVGNPAHTGREDAIGMPPQRPTLVPVERYLSVEFARLETQQMWPKVWQVACTVDHVAEAGDYFEYRCGPCSVLIVRGDDGTLRAFQKRVPTPGQLAAHRVGRGLARTAMRSPRVDV
jgi:choline monooxygenase